MCSSNSGTPSYVSDGTNPDTARLYTQLFTFVTVKVNKCSWCEIFSDFCYYVFYLWFYHRLGFILFIHFDDEVYIWSLFTFACRFAKLLDNRLLTS